MYKTLNPFYIFFFKFYKKQKKQLKKCRESSLKQIQKK